MPGFFSKDVVRAQKAPEPPPRARKRGGKPRTCDTCGLFKGCLSPKMDWSGEGRKKILVIAEAPGENEDIQGRQLVGDAGQEVRGPLAEMGVDLDRDCWTINAVNCRPTEVKDGETKNRKPTRLEIECCREVKVDKAIRELQPEHIFLMGESALISYLQGRQDNLVISNWRGHSFPDPVNKAWVHVMFHPAAILYGKNPNDKKARGDPNMRAVFRRDLQVAINKSERPFPDLPKFEETIEQLTTYKQIKFVLENVLEWYEGLLVFDYETNSLKPYKEGAAVVSVAFTIDGDGKPKTYAFPLEHSEAKHTTEQLIELTKLWRQILQSGRIRKVAHNLKFENKWSRHYFGAKVKGWTSCTMNTAHILDNTPKTTGLKIQAFLNFGVEDYERASLKYIDSKDGEDFNTMHLMPLDQLLLYNGMDSAITWELHKKQERLLGSGKLRAVNDFWLESLFTLAEIEDHGIPVDEDYFRKQDRKIDEEIAQVQHELLTSKEARLFMSKEGERLDLESAPQLGRLFYKHLGLTAPKKTAKGADSVDAEAFEKLNHPFAKKIIQYRKLQKIKKSYFSQFLHSIYNGHLYPSFDLHTVRTYRSSSSDPNFQNIPVRDEQAKALVRKGIMPSKGHKLLEIDFGSLEVRGLAMYSKDKALMAYIRDPNTDMHRDQAMQLFKFTREQWDALPKKVADTIRFHAKNSWVFPLFYGSWYKACANNLWENVAELDMGDGRVVRQHFKMGYKRFEEHCRSLEKQFWKKFQGVRDWQESLAREYQSKGYIETYLGFRYNLWMTRNNLYNYKIQGSCFHILLWCVNRLHAMSKARGWNSRIIGQIHDSVIWDLDPAEEREVLTACNQVLTKEVTEEWGWINVPLEVEPEITGVNEPWYFKERTTLEAAA